MRISLHPSEHMLGGAQVRVELSSGLCIGYSGDFAWPLDDVMQVEVLVVDPTYGSPNSIREYSQADAESALLTLIGGLRQRGPVHILAHQGTLQRVLQVFTGEMDMPVVGTAKLMKEVEVYRNFGYPIGEILDYRSAPGREVMQSGTYIRLFGPGDQRPIPDGRICTIKLSAFMAKPDDPVVKYSDRAYGVAVSNHADFIGTLEYVRATGARLVVVDNSRGGHAFELCEQIHLQLGLDAEVAEVQHSLEWGK
jgi:hypothetical protein